MGWKTLTLTLNIGKTQVEVSAAPRPLVCRARRQHRARGDACHPWVAKEQDGDKCILCLPPATLARV